MLGFLVEMLLMKLKGQMIMVLLLQTGKLVRGPAGSMKTFRKSKYLMKGESGACCETQSPLILGTSKEK